MATEGTPKIAVIGGGISGLVAARRLAPSAFVTVFETTERFGGLLGTNELRGHVVDTGPDSFITRNPSAADLCRELGLGDELVAPKGGFAALYSRGQLRALPQNLAIGVPTSLPALLRSGTVGPRALRASLDYVLPRRRPRADPVEIARAGGDDPSVSEVLGPRLGPEVLYGLVDPLIGGINASDVDVLSFAAAVPDLARRAKQKRVLMRALRAPTRTNEQLAPAFVGITSGIESLARALVGSLERAGVDLRPSTEVTSVNCASSTHAWHVSSNVGSEVFDGVIIATPAQRTSAIVAELDSELSSLCSQITYASVVTVTLAFKTDDVSSTTAGTLARIGTKGPRRAEHLTALPGNGVLVPRRHGELVTALSFTSTKWPNAAAPDEVVIRASLGRHHDERAVSLEDGPLLERVLVDIRSILGISADPLDVLITRYPASFPQYTTGHLARIAAIEARATSYRGLGLCGAAYNGIGIPACIDSGYRSAETVLATILT